MANSYYQIYIHSVFAVKFRNAIIDNEWKKELNAVIGNIINERGCETIIVNGVEDHIHCLFKLKSTETISDVMKNAKARSSKWINDNNLTDERFEWQNGYGAFSYSKSQIPQVYNYILNQEEYHKNQLFRDEYIDILEKFGIDFDEKYLFEDLIETISPIGTVIS